MTTLSECFLVEEPQTICGVQVSSIVDDYVEQFPSIVDRFYTRYYYAHPGRDDEPQLVLFHSNRICLIGLAPEHVALRKGVRSVSFEVGKCDRSENKVSGKKKAGGMVLQTDSTLALVTCDDGTVYKLRACVRSKLVEVNDRIATNPALLGVEGEGYVAVVIPKLEQCDAIKEMLMTREQYLERLAENRTLIN